MNYCGQCKFSETVELETCLKLVCKKKKQKDGARKNPFSIQGFLYKPLNSVACEHFEMKGGKK